MASNPTLADARDLREKVSIPSISQLQADPEWGAAVEVDPDTGARIGEPTYKYKGDETIVFGEAAEDWGSYDPAGEIKALTKLAETDEIGVGDRLFKADGSVVVPDESGETETVNEDFTTAKVSAVFRRGAKTLIEEQGLTAFDPSREGVSLISVGNRTTIQTDSGGSAIVLPEEDANRFVQATQSDNIDVEFSDAPALSERLADRRERSENREAARDAAAAAGVDLDEFGIDARADGEVIVQDRDTGRTRTIDADAPGGVGSAIDAATGDGQFVADDADPAASGSGSGDGLGARAAGAVVLLFGSLAAALGWLS